MQPMQLSSGFDALNLGLSVSDDRGKLGVVQNGRANILLMQTPPSQFLMFEQVAPKKQGMQSILSNPAQGMLEQTQLGKLFMSSANLQIVQNALRNGVYEMSNKQYIIGNQSIEELTAIMRAIFDQFSANLPNHITDQIIALNQMVVNYTVPKLFSEAQGRIAYLWDVSTLVTPIDRPVMVSQADRTLELKSFF